MDNKRHQRNKIKMQIGYWIGKSSQNPKYLGEAEAKILELKKELMELTNKSPYQIQLKKT